MATIKVLSPGTVIISAGAEVSDVKKVTSPVIKNVEGSEVWHIDLSYDTLKLGGSSFAQVLNQLGTDAPTV